MLDFSAVNVSLVCRFKGITKVKQLRCVHHSVYGQDFLEA